jgi:hypothetical protein
MNTLNALIIGESSQIMYGLTSLLFRSGFNIDVITNNLTTRHF